MSNVIKIASKNKDAMIRVSEKTKRKLNALSIGKETYEQIIARLIKEKETQLSAGTKIVQSGKVTGTKYERNYKVFTIDYNGVKYEVVCTYNDLAIIANLMQNSQIREYAGKDIPEWEVELEIVNIRKGKENWVDPSSFKKNQEYLLLYFACLKQILEETFSIKVYQVTDEGDYLSKVAWDEAYKHFGLSRESFYTDVERLFK